MAPKQVDPLATLKVIRDLVYFIDRLPTLASRLKPLNEDYPRLAEHKETLSKLLEYASEFQAWCNEQRLKQPNELQTIFDTISFKIIRTSTATLSKRLQRIDLCIIELLTGTFETKPSWFRSSEAPAESSVKTLINCLLDATATCNRLECCLGIVHQKEGDRPQALRPEDEPFKQFYDVAIEALAALMGENCPDRAAWQDLHTQLEDWGRVVIDAPCPLDLYFVLALEHAEGYKLRMTDAFAKILFAVGLAIAEWMPNGASKERIQHAAAQIGTMLDSTYLFRPAMDLWNDWQTRELLKTVKWKNLDRSLLRSEDVAAVLLEDEVPQVQSVQKCLQELESMKVYLDGEQARYRRQHGWMWCSALTTKDLIAGVSYTNEEQPQPTWMDILRASSKTRMEEAKKQDGGQKKRLLSLACFR